MALPDQAPDDAGRSTVLPARIRFEDVPGLIEGLHSAQVLDLSEVRDFDSSLVAVLLELQRRARQQGRSLRTVNAPDKLRKLVTLYGAEGLLLDPRD